jgi:hypothetical protein
MRWAIAMTGAVAALVLLPATAFVQAEVTEKQAIAAIEKLGGRVKVREKTPGKPIVTSVRLERTPVTDADLVHLKALKGLSFLSLANTKVTNGGLRNLAGLKNLTYLSLASTKVSDAGLKHLQNLAELKDLVQEC